MNKSAFRTAVIAAAALGALASSADAKTVKWTAVAGSAPFVGPVKILKDVIIPEINKRIAAENKDFKIEWTQAYAQSLAKFPDVFETLEEGIAHLAVNFPNFEASKLPLEQYMRVVPWGVIDNLTAVRIDEAVRKKVPELDAAWPKFNQIRLSSAASPSFDMFTTFAIKRVDDLKGKKIGASGSYASYLRGTGAVAVNAMMASSYVDIKNGVYDGYPISIALALPLKTYEVAKYYTGVHFAATVTPTITVNKKAFEALPGWVRKIIRESADLYGPKYAAFEDGRRGKFIGIMKSKGVKFSELPKSEIKRWANMMPNVPKEWAERVEKRNKLPAKKVLRVYMDELRSRNIDPVRNWDKE